MATTIAIAVGVTIFAIQILLVAYIIAHELYKYLHLSKLVSLLPIHHHHDKHHLAG